MFTSQASTPKKFSSYLATYGMWLMTAILAVYQIALVREIVLSIYAWVLFWTGRNAQVRTDFEAAALGQWVTIVMAILAIVLIIGGFEYYHKRVGDAKALKILSWTLGIQGLILLIGFVV
jgi:hypothetical protein